MSQESASKKKAPCHFFKIGKCLKGDQCPFQHTLPPTPSKASAPPSPSAMEHEESITVNFAGLTIGSEPKDPQPFFSYNQAVGSASSSATTTAPVSPLSGISLPPSIPKTNELCPFAITGKCRYGVMCRNIHGIQCPRCLKFCLHPDDLDQNEEHIQQCLENPLAQAIETEDEKRIECGICYEQVLSKPDPRFGLLNCEHAFCISCIRTWRSKHAMDSTNLRSCPLCRTITYFVVPSSVWVTVPAEKQAIIEAYKKKLSSIRCRHYSQGAANCPFGTSCFYSHANEDGSVDKPQLRTVVGQSERPNVYRETRLSDFIVFKDPHQPAQ